MQQDARIPKRKRAPQRSIRVSNLAKRLAELRALRDLVRRAEGQFGKVDRLGQGADRVADDAA